MKLSGVSTPQEEGLPGVVGTARVERRPGDLLRRVKAGDIAVIDHTDLDRRTAEALVTAGVAGVVNAAPSISGKFPNLGPEVLLSAGVTLIDRVGSAMLHRVKDGARLRLHEGGVFAGDEEIGRGDEQDANSVADQLIEAKVGMSHQLEAFSANTIEFLRKERMLVLDGIGIPEVTVPMEHRHALVVAPGYGHADDLKMLKSYIRECRPVLIGVEAGAETLWAAGYQPDIIVGSPDEIDSATLKCGAEVVIPAHADGHAAGLERVQDLGIGAVTFPASGNPEDLALLLADAHRASLVITVGFQASLPEFLDRGRSGSNPSTFLTRLRLGSKLVDGSAVPILLRSRFPTAAILILVLSALVVMLVAFVVSGLGWSYVDVLSDAGSSVFTSIRGLLS